MVLGSPDSGLARRWSLGYIWAEILNVELNINMLHMHWFNCTAHSHVPSCGHGREQAELDVAVDQELSDCWWPLLRSCLTSSRSTYGKPLVWISVRSFVLKKHRSLHSWPTAMFIFTFRTVSFYKKKVGNYLLEESHHCSKQYIRIAFSTNCFIKWRFPTHMFVLLQAFKKWLCHRPLSCATVSKR